MDVWSNKLLATYGHLVLPPGPFKLERSFAQQLLPQCTSLACSCLPCCPQLSRRKAEFGISRRNIGALSANREWDCELQWTSKKVNLRLDVSLRATAAALGQLQSKTSAFHRPWKVKAKTFSVSPDQREPSYIHQLLCPKTSINKYQSYGHRYCYSCYLYIMQPQPSLP